MLTVWTQPSGYSFGIFQEQASVTLELPLQPVLPNDVTFTVISGNLPGGLRIAGSQIVGTPYIVSNVIDYKFCIRAQTATDFADRTYLITIDGSNPPIFITPIGELKIGVHQQLYALDSSYISYQLEAFDLNTALGTTLNYFIGSNDGQLPPGLTLSSSGLISGFILPSLSITPADGTGLFDESYFDAVAYDFGNAPTDGFDSYQYDDVFFDYNLPSTVPSSLNANYQFKVTVSDGISFAQRIFKIFVVGTDQFRADSTSLDGFAGSFTADATYLRQPVWLTGAFLGTYRANNYITVPVALYDNNSTIFRLETTNEEVYAVTFQVATYDNLLAGNTVTISNVKGTPTIGQYFTFDNYIVAADSTVYQIANVASLGNNTYRLTLSTNLMVALQNGTPFYIGTLSALPPGTTFDVNTGDIFGRVPYQPAVTRSYNFTITATRIDPTASEVVNSSRTFNIKILGDVSSAITWNIDSNLGILHANYVSTLSVSASSNVPGAVVVYQLDSGNLPPGLELSIDGEIIGMVNQYYSSSTGVKGLITFDGGLGTFDHNQTSMDRLYTFTISASDQFGYSMTSQVFTITIDTPNTVAYSNITTRPFLVPAQRTAWRTFINNTNIFTPDSIYRPNDTNFGLQSTLSMLVYAGIQTQQAAAYVGAMGLNHKRKRFQFSTVKSAIAVDPITKMVVYEVVYIQMVDPLEPNGLHLPAQVHAVNGVESNTITVDNSTAIWSNNPADLNANAPSASRPEPIMTVDSTGYEVSNPNTNTYFPNSISNWQTRLQEVGLTERNYLPLWMRSIQAGTKEQLGYALAVPVCFCKVGTSSSILLNIKYSGFDFRTLDYTVDRFTIDSVTGDTSDKYLVFRNDRITV